MRLKDNRLQARVVLPKEAPNGAIKMGATFIELLDADGNVVGELAVDDKVELALDMFNARVAATATFEATVREATEDDE